VAEKEAKREETAHFLPVAGTVSSCVVLDEAGDEVFSLAAGFGTPEGEVAWNAMRQIAELLDDGGFYSGNSADHDVQVRLFGLRIRDRLRVMAMDALRYCAGEGLPTSAIPVGLWYHRPFAPAPWCDPYDAAIPSENRNDIPFDGLAQFLGIELPQDANIDTDPRLQADLARHIALAANLFPV